MRHTMNKKTSNVVTVDEQRKNERKSNIIIYKEHAFNRAIKRQAAKHNRTDLLHTQRNKQTT